MPELIRGIVVWLIAIDCATHRREFEIVATGRRILGKGIDNGAADRVVAGRIVPERARVRLSPGASFH